MAFFDDLKNRWERLAPRERRLLQLLGLTAIACVFGFVGFQVNDGLREIERRNDDVREALRTIELHRDSYEQSRAQDTAALIGPEAPPLATYLDQLAQETGFPIPEATERPPVTKGKFVERSIDLKLRGLTVQQLADFLQKVETRSPTVVTQRLYVKTYFNQHDKLDVELTVATWERAKKEAAKDAPKKAEEQGG